MSEWINDCKSNHDKCQVDKTDWVPSRLLDVRCDQGTEHLKLIEAAQQGTCAPYAALSHMWGDSSMRAPLRTLVSNYDDMSAGIPMSMLPRNFADAVITTRALGLSYLWIDSLCIIQDSATDWHKEAATMHKVYKYAEITIAA